MRINHNLSALNISQCLLSSGNAQAKSIEKLSSGLRINRAGDDAAGLAISEKMRAQIRGLDQASRNIQDGISLIQTAEGGLNEVHELLQRGRELSVQAANDTNTKEDKQSIQKEITQIKEEINRIANDTEFNTKKLLNSSSSSSTNKQTIINNLQKGWLSASEQLISNTYGIGGNNLDIKVKLDDTIDGAGNTVAMVRYSYTPGVAGTGSNLELHIDMADFTNTAYPDGGGWIANDRVIAHEMTHAAMAASINVSSGMETWFMEGTAEAVTGADERLASSLSRLDVQDLADRIGTGSSWGGTSDDYSMAYAAVRYMDYLIASNGGTGVKDIITYMASDTTKTLNDAIANNVNLRASGVTDIATFASKFTSSNADGGVAYITNQLVPNLGNADTGSFSGSDRGTGGTLTNEDVVDESLYGTANTNPLSTYNVVWPLPDNGTKFKIQAGANSLQTIQIDQVDVRPSSLGIDSVDVMVNPDQAITAFDGAIQTVSGFRSTFGAVQNRLETAISVVTNTSENLTAAESRIRDVDMAKEMVSQSKNSILSQAAQAMLAQANQMPQTVLQLLR